MHDDRVDAPLSHPSVCVLRVRRHTALFESVREREYISRSLEGVCGILYDTATTLDTRVGAHEPRREKCDRVLFFGEREGVI